MDPVRRQAVDFLQRACAEGWIARETLGQAVQALQRGQPADAVIAEVQARVAPQLRERLGQHWAQGSAGSRRLAPQPARSTPSPSPSLPGRAPSRAGERLGKYELLSELGRGGMGVVYRARDTALGREVALKLLSTQNLSPERRERFRLEAEVSARLRHPGIVPIYDVGRDDQGAPFLVMDLVEGEALSTKLQREGPLKPRVAAGLVLEVANALHHAHERAVLHRDLKPDNVILTPEGRPVVVDFGLAKVLEDDARQAATRSGAIVGTPGYLPPEQAARSGVIDWRADVYGLGALLYALLTGEAPFAGETLLEILAAVVGREASPPSRERAGIDRDLDTICLTCLEKEPQARYPSAQALAEDLQRFLANQPVQARPQTVARRAKKWVARNRKLSGVLAAGALLAALAGVAWVEVERQRKADEAQRQASTRQTALDDAKREALAQAAHDAEQAWSEFAATDPESSERLALALRCVQTGHGVRALDASAEGAAPLLRAALSLGEVARHGKQWELAREAYRQAAGLPGGLAAAEQGLSALETERQAKQREREQAVRAVLEDVASGAARQRPEGLADATFEILRFPGDDTQALLATQLREICRTLLHAEAEALVRGSPPGTPLQALRDALLARERNLLDDAPPPNGEQLAHISRALQLASGAAPSPALRVPARYLKALQTTHTRALGPGGEDLSQVLCRCLGRLRGEAGRQALYRYLHLETSPRRAVFAGIALLRFGDSAALDRVNNAKLRLGDAYRAPIDRFLGNHAVESEAEVPEHAMALANAAGHKLTIKDYAGAIKDTTKALALDPNAVQALSTRALAYLKTQRYAEAREDIRRAVELSPENPVLWNNYGQVVENRPGGLQQALEAYNRSLALKTQPGVLVNRALIYKRMGQAQRALQDLDAAIELAPNRARAFAERGLLRGMTGQTAAAVSDLDKAVELDPRQEGAWANRGMAYSSLGKYTVALESYDTAIALAPTTAHHFAQRARVRLLLKDYAGALDDSTHSIELDPRPGEAYFYRGSAHANLGDREAAARDAQQALRRVPQRSPLHGEAQRLLDSVR